MAEAYCSNCKAWVPLKAGRCPRCGKGLTRSLRRVIRHLGGLGW